MEDELSRLLEGFSLTEKEITKLIPPEEILAKAQVRGRLCLMAYVAVEKTVNMEAFRSTTLKVW